MSKWEWKTLQDVCLMKIKDGTHQTPTYCSPNNGFPFLSSKDITSEKINWDNIKYIIPDLHKELYAKIAPQKDDILLAKNGTTGVAALVEDDRVFDVYVTLAVLRPNQQVILPNYLLRIVNSPICKSQFDAHLKGMGVPNLHLNEIQKVLIPVPPLSEQKRIVKFLDEEFSKIDTLKTNAETNLKNAKELFETTLEKELNPLSRHSERSEESSADLPSGWEWKTLRELCILRPSKNEALSHLKGTDEVSFLPMEDLNIRERNTIPHKSRALSEVHGSYTFFAEGDVLLAKVTPCFENGKMGIASNLLNGVGFGSSEYIVFRTTKSMINSYLFYVLMSSRFISGGKKQMLGACGLKRLSKEYVESFQIPLPPLSVQKEIVARLDKLSENVKRLEVNYKQIIANCDELKKSILKKTFEGDSRSSRE